MSNLLASYRGHRASGSGQNLHGHSVSLSAIGAVSCLSRSQPVDGIGSADGR